MKYNQALIAAALLAPTSARRPVTCAMTIDNRINEVSYNGKVLTPIKGKGQEGNWVAEKRYEFIPIKGVQLKIKGEEYSNCDGTRCSGLAMECHDPEGGIWSNFGTSTKHCSAKKGSMCKTTSGFRLIGGFSRAQHDKIWPCHDEKHAEFSCSPEKPVVQPVTCAMTIDNKINEVSYNGKVLTPIKGKGQEGNWVAEKRYEFIPIKGVQLKIKGEEYSNCDGTRCSGLAMECHDPSGGDWANFGTSTSKCVAERGNMCKTTSGFRLVGGFDHVGHEKIWPCHNGKYATISCAPMTFAPTASPTTKPTEKCDATNCGSWTCEDWCECYDDTKDTVYDSKRECRDEGDATCICDK